MKNNLLLSAAFIAMGTASLAANAGPTTGALPEWATFGYTQFADDDGIVGPGGGGQAFDAEYLYYKQSGSYLYLGLQSGFDLVDGHQTYGSKDYYAGDLALSFDGDASTFEYGIDFGLYTEGYSGAKVDMDPSPGDGIDAAGLYGSAVWSNDVIASHMASVPFALDGGSFLKSIDTWAGENGALSTFWRVVRFNTTGLGLGDTVDVHWTMSCGNDAIDGQFTKVPEPGTLALFGIGLMGLGIIRARKSRG